MMLTNNDFHKIVVKAQELQALLEELKARDELDRHERAAVSSDIYHVEQLIEKYKHYCEAGFVDF